MKYNNKYIKFKVELTLFKNILTIILALITFFTFSNNAIASIDEENKTAQKEEPSVLKGSATIINIKSDLVEYFQDKDQFVATGNVVITVEDDGTVIKSDEVIYDRKNELIISERDVKIIKRGTVIDGDYARFDLTKESAIINNPDTYLRQIRINSKEALIHSEDIEMLKGNATLLEEDMVLVLSAGSMGAGRQKDFFQKRPDIEPRLNYDIKAKEIIVEDTEYRKIVTMRNAQISINKFKIAKIPELKMTSAEEAGYITFKRNKKTGMPSLKMETVKKTNRIETMLPEFGHRRELGSYVGHGHVFNLPKGSTLKALPIFTFGDGDGSSIGIGGMARYMSSSNETELLYSTLRNKFVLEGAQRILTPFTKIQYSSYSFIDNGFFGRQKPAYLIEVVDNRKLAEAYNSRFSLRSTAGMVERAEGNYATGRFQLQGYLNNINPLWSYDDYLSLGYDSNFHIGVYGTGDTYGVLRAGPTVWSELGPFSLWAAYYQGAVQGETPFLFDEYRYGKSNFVFNGKVRITDYLTFGYAASFNLTKDNWEEELVTENRIYFFVGPDDLKFKIGYDVERARTLFGIDMLVGSETSALEFEKLRVIQR